MSLTTRVTLPKTRKVPSRTSFIVGSIKQMVLTVSMNFILANLFDNPRRCRSDGLLNLSILLNYLTSLLELRLHRNYYNCSLGEMGQGGKTRQDGLLARFLTEYSLDWCDARRLLGQNRNWTLLFLLLSSLELAPRRWSANAIRLIQMGQGDAATDSRPCKLTKRTSVR